MVKHVIHTHSAQQTITLGEHIGKLLKGGEVFEFVSDLGGGKTTFVRGLAKGFGAGDVAASPSFTISYVYPRPDGKQLHHFDFYRLNDAGIVANELAEAITDSQNVIVVEWGELVHDELPNLRINVTIENSAHEEERIFTFNFPVKFEYLFDDAILKK